MEKLKIYEIYARLRKIAARKIDKKGLVKLLIDANDEKVTFKGENGQLTIYYRREILI